MPDACCQKSGVSCSERTTAHDHKTADCGHGGFCGEWDTTIGSREVPSPTDETGIVETQDCDQDLLDCNNLDSLFGTGVSAAIAREHNLPGGSMFFLAEKKGVLNAISPAWEKLTLTVDSGASDTVVPPSVCSSAPLVRGSKFGIEYEIADGNTVENLGERLCLMKTSENATPDTDALEMQFQVVDVSKALMSVHRVCEQGHDVLFSNGTRGSAILVGGDVRNRIPLRHVGGTYELDVWVKPSPDFTRQR